jgi:hypothetical protein
LSSYVYLLTFYLPPQQAINEFHYTNSGPETGEFIEIVSPTDVPAPVHNSHRVVLYDGGSGKVYPALTPTSNPATIGTPLAPTPPSSSPSTSVVTTTLNGFRYTVISYPIDGLQNGGKPVTGDGFALVDPSGDVVQFLSYEKSFRARNGPANTQTSIDVGVFEPGNTAGTSVFRCRNNPAVWRVGTSTTRGSQNPKCPGVPAKSPTKSPLPCVEATTIDKQTETVTISGSTTSIGTADTVRRTTVQTEKCRLYNGYGIWYKIKPFTSNRNLIAYTCNAVTEFDTVITVYRGDNCRPQVCVAQNDDSGAGVETCSTVRFTVSPSTTYWIFVDGHAITGDQGYFQLIVGVDKD